MGGNAFFDTNMLLGYCILLDQHHKKCKDYVVKNPDGNFYISQSVEEEYLRKKSSISSKLETGILDHVQRIQSKVEDGYLGPIELDSLQRSHIDPDNPAGQFLFDYYAKIKSGGLNTSDLTGNLRKLARSIHVIGDLRREVLNKEMMGWLRNKEYTDIKEKLETIHEPDRSHCIDAHDLASRVGGHTTLVSSDVKDIISNSELIKRETEIEDIQDVSV